MKRPIFVHEPIDLGYETLGDASVEGTRIYVTPSGAHYPSITTVLGIRSKDSIAEWRKRVGDAEADRISLQACTRGNEMHSIAENYLNNVKDYLGDNKDSQGEDMFRSIQDTLNKNIGKILMQEVPLYSDIFKIAGRVDLIAEYNGELSVIDFKTSSKAKLKSWIHSYFIQAAFYAAAFYERTQIPIKQSVIIMAVENQKAPLIFKENTFVWLPEVLKAIREYNAVVNI